MSIIKVADIAHVRFRAPNLGAMQSFLQDFGLKTELHDDGRLYASGLDGRPFVHVTEEGEPGFIGLGLRAPSLQALEHFADVEGLPVEELAAPGGGRCVTLTDPDGVQVELVVDQTKSPVSELPRQPLSNSASGKSRMREAVRLRSGPSHVLRIGHCVMNVSDFRTSERWYKERFGFITSDEVEAAKDVPIGAFMRCDRGTVPVDHHTIFLAQLPQKTGFMHAAFEVIGFDDLMLGHAHLKARGRESVWGIGRHILGSQIFDYWNDPWGHELEHWTDGDLFAVEDGSNHASVDDLLAVQWGMQSPVFDGALAPSPAVMRVALALTTRLKRFFRRQG